MKILIINEKLEWGGTEVQTKREIKTFAEYGHEMYLLTFDNNYPLILDEGKSFNIPINFSLMDKVRCKILMKKKYVNVISELISKIKPDFIHINNLQSIPVDVYECVKSYPVVQTIRDFGAICPKETCIHDNYAICQGYTKERCAKCLKLDPYKWYRLYRIKMINKYRKKAVDVCVSPSAALAKACSNNGINTLCLNNPFDFSSISNTGKKNNKKVFLYYGMISEIKGVSILAAAFKQFYNSYSECELWFVGNVDDAFLTEFDGICKNDYVKYLGKKTNAEIMELYSQIYCVVVPSLWIENYPNTVLEAIANKTLVIGSNRGGIPELIGKEELLFDIQCEEDVLNKLEYCVTLTESEYKDITEQRYNYIIKNNSCDSYYNSLMHIYENM